MRKIALKLLAGAFALTIYTSGAMAEHDCTIANNPHGPNTVGTDSTFQGDVCTITSEYISDLDSGTDEQEALAYELTREGYQDTSIQSNVNRLVNQDTRIDKEVTDRKAADAALNQTIGSLAVTVATEMAVSVAADAALDAKIDQETTDRVAADAAAAAAQGTTDAAQDAAAAAAALTQGTTDADQDVKIGDNATAIATETADRIAADNVQDGKIDSNTAAIGNWKDIPNPDFGKEIPNPDFGHKIPNPDFDSTIPTDPVDNPEFVLEDPDAPEFVLEDPDAPEFIPSDRTTTVKKAVEDVEHRVETNEDDIRDVDALATHNQTTIRDNESASVRRDNDLGTRIDTESAASVRRDNALGNRISNNTTRIDENEQAIKDSLALSLAIPSDYVSPGKNASIAGGFGVTDGAQALGLTASFRFNTEITTYIGGSTLLDSDSGSNDWALKGGARYEW